MSETQYAYDQTLRAKQRDERSLTGPFIQWTPPGAFGVPFALFREPDGVVIVSPELLPPDTVAALPPAPVSRNRDAAIVGRLTVTAKEQKR